MARWPLGAVAFGSGSRWEPGGGVQQSAVACPGAAERASEHEDAGARFRWFSHRLFPSRVAPPSGGRRLERAEFRTRTAWETLGILERGALGEQREGRPTGMLSHPLCFPNLSFPVSLSQSLFPSPFLTSFMFSQSFFSILLSQTSYAGYAFA